VDVPVWSSNQPMDRVEFLLARASQISQPMSTRLLRHRSRHVPVAQCAALRRRFLSAREAACRGY
jgi:hypothetical protein